MVGEQNSSVVELCPGQAKILWSRAETKTDFVAVPSVPHDPLKTVTAKSFRLCLYLMQTLNYWWNCGSRYVRGCIFSSGGTKHTLKFISETRVVSRAKKVGS